MKKLVVVLFTVIAVMAMTMTFAAADDSWMTVKEFDALASEVYADHPGMIWTEVIFTISGSIRLDVNGDDGRIEYWLLGDNEWKVEDQELFLSTAAVLDVISTEMPVKKSLNYALGTQEDLWVYPADVFSVIQFDSNENRSWRVIGDKIVTFSSGDTLKGFIMCDDDQFMMGNHPKYGLMPFVSAKATYFAFK